MPVVNSAAADSAAAGCAAADAVAGRTAPRLSGVIFDMDGVLVDSEPLSMGTIAEVVAEHGGQASPAILAELTGISLDEALSAVASASGRVLDTGVLRESYDARYLPRLRALAAPTPGLTRLMTALAAAGVPMGLASSSSLAEIDAVVTTLDLRDALRAIGSAQEVARPKPAPDVYRLAIERLGAGPGGVVAIEDSATGLAAATAAGLRCVAVRTPATRTHDLSAAALVIRSLEELSVPILANLTAPPP